MPSKSLFSEPFDDGTIFKLKIFDLFAGMGKDFNDVPGSPLIIVEEINKNKLTIAANKLDVTIVLNEFEKTYFDALSFNLETIVDKKCYSLELFNSDFKSVFTNKITSMKDSANFLFLDQNGIKQITEDIFNKIICLKQTDFLFFISSSFINRFGDSDSFQKYLKITKQDLKDKSYYHIHRIVLAYYRSLIPKDVKYYLAPFSIKKPTGIYGLIFGTNHLYGLEKFLKVCWRHDKLTGEANFDIDSEKIDINRPSLFKEYNIPKKLQSFENNLEEKILSEILKTDLEVYTYTLEEGFLPKHANEILKRMLEENIISFEFKLLSNKIHKIEIPSLIKKNNHGTIKY